MHRASLSRSDDHIFCAMKYRRAKPRWPRNAIFYITVIFRLTPISFQIVSPLLFGRHRWCMTLPSFIFHVSFREHRGHIHSARFLKPQHFIAINSPAYPWSLSQPFSLFSDFCWFYFIFLFLLIEQKWSLDYLTTDQRARRDATTFFIDVAIVLEQLLIRRLSSSY